MSRNEVLKKANKAKNDEFYTQLKDIEEELQYYKHHFKDKVVYCNCDNPEASNFWKYFTNNFEELELAGVVSTHYVENGQSYFLMKYLEGLKKIDLKGDGDFRSQECIDILKECDIIVTNPPFSLFRKYIGQLMEYDKKFLIIGNQNAIAYKEVFPLFKENKIWLGYNSVKSFLELDGNIKSFGNVRWFTNLEVDRKNEPLKLSKKYCGKDYQSYDNYKAINVDRVKDIPFDYYGVMGVPISFMDKYCPEQFDIVGLTSGRYEFECRPIKEYVNPVQINPDRTRSNGSKANTGAMIKINSLPKDKVIYTADNIAYYLTRCYTRILIKRK